MTVAVVTDSTCDIPPEVAQELEIKEELPPYGRVRGRAKAIDALVKYASKLSNPGSLAVEYYMDADDAKAIVGGLEQKSPGVPIYTSSVGALVRAHTGLHALFLPILEGGMV